MADVWLSGAFGTHRLESPNNGMFIVEMEDGTFALDDLWEPSPIKGFLTLEAAKVAYKMLALASRPR